MAGAFLKSVNTVSTLLVLFVASLAFLPLVCESKINPYNVLNVPKRATTQEIRKSYKNLAKEWHPDKNSDPKAQDKFVEINAAYELLSDAERRQKYDTHGITDDQPQHRHHPENSGHRRFHSPFDFFEDDFFSHGQQQRGGAGGSSEQRLYHKQSVTSHQYYNTVLPESAEKPYLILFFSDWCFTCLRIEPIWAK
jgi:DnaJ family protein C protein 16